MQHTELRGSPAEGAHSSVADLLVFARELLEPTLVHPTTLAEATDVQFPDLAGVIPGFGRHDPNPWGLGFEIRGDKQPHWTGTTNSDSAFGHFGGSGTFLWVDPPLGLACAAIGGVPFDEWAVRVWPPTSDAVISRLT
jgi:CubicO group peptidase (beta-lactamase class C family)